MTLLLGSTTADEAFTCYESYKPDLVIIDYKPPGHKNWISCCKRNHF